jgi:hypothetical protein
MRRSGRAFGAAVGVMLLVTACSSGGNSTSASTRRSGTRTPSEPRVTGVQVNLTVTGDRTAVIQGSKGTCSIPPFGAPTYTFNGKDYPTLGKNGSVSIAGPLIINGGAGVPASAKVIVDDVGLLSPANGSGISLSKNELVVMVNAPISGGTGDSADNNLDAPSATVHAQLTGSIRCTTRN